MANECESDKNPGPRDLALGCFLRGLATLYPFGVISWPVLAASLIANLLFAASLQDWQDLLKRFYLAGHFQWFGRLAIRDSTLQEIVTGGEKNLEHEAYTLLRQRGALTPDIIVAYYSSGNGVSSSGNEGSAIDISWTANVPLTPASASYSIIVVFEGINNNDVAFHYVDLEFTVYGP